MPAPDPLPAALLRPPPGSSLRGIALKVTATGLFTLMGAVIKSVGADYPIGQIVFCRSAFALIPVLLLVQAGGGWRLLRTRRPFSHVLRSLSGCCAMVGTFAALTLLPLADATALAFAAPLMATALAVPLLGERVRAYRWTAVLVGFAGVLLMVQPHGQASGPMLFEAVPLGVAFALGGAFFTALAMIAIRRMVGTEPGPTIVFYFTLTTTVAGAASLAFEMVLPPPDDALRLVAIGLLGGCAQLVLTAAYRQAPVSALAPFDYAALLWALIIGYAWFGELPSLLVLAGAAIVIGAGLVIVWRERTPEVAAAPAATRSHTGLPPATS